MDPRDLPLKERCDLEGQMQVIFCDGLDVPQEECMGKFVDRSPLHPQKDRGASPVQTDTPVLLQSPPEQVLKLEPCSELNLEWRTGIVVEQVVPVHILDAEEIGVGRGGETAVTSDR